MFSVVFGLVFLYKLYAYFYTFSFSCFVACLAGVRRDG